MSGTLVLLRHAVAEERRLDLEDGERRLTPAGVRRMEQGARGLRRIGLQPDLILTSPLRRARETAAILARVSAPACPCEIVDWLAPGRSLPRASALARGRAGRGVVVLVGHEPDLGRLASLWLSGSPGLVRAPLKKGGAAAFRIDSTAAPAELLWWLPPRLLRRLAGKG